MAAAVKLQTDFTTWDLRRLAAASKHANQRRRRLSLPRTQFQHHHSEGQPPKMTTRETIRELFAHSSLAPHEGTSVALTPYRATRLFVPTTLALVPPTIAYSRFGLIRMKAG
jgi:hypothetical protein